MASELNACLTLDLKQDITGEASTIKAPLEIGGYSLDSNHEYVADSTSLKYYYSPKIGDSLASGFENFAKYDESVDLHLTHLLCCLSDIEKRDFARNGRFSKTTGDFCSYRGMMTKFICAPFFINDGYVLNATLFQDTIFIEEDHATKRDLESYGQDYSRELMQFMGYKFETLSTLDKHPGKTTPEEIENRHKLPVSNAEQYCSIKKTSCGDVSITIGGEVDAIACMKPPFPLGENPCRCRNCHDDDALPTLPICHTVFDQEIEDARMTHIPFDSNAIKPQYVELKTLTVPKGDHHYYTLHKDRMLRWWAQSFILGIQTILAGYRDQDQGLKNTYLHSIQEFETTQLPRLAQEWYAKKGREVPWTRAMALGWFSRTLKFIKSTIHESAGQDVDEFEGSGVWVISKRARTNQIKITKKSSRGFGGIVSDEFIEWRRSVKEGRTNVTKVPTAEAQDEEMVDVTD